MPAPRGKVKKPPGARRPETAGRKERKNWTMDNQAQIQLCLHCEKKTCSPELCREVMELSTKKQKDPHISFGGRACKLPEILNKERMELWQQGLTDQEIAERLNLSTYAIAKWRQQRGLAANRKPKKRTARGADAP